MSTKNDLLLRAARGEKVERPPVWLMRQAGRILPQYRALRGRLSGFKELVETPALAAEVTLQPVDELGVDAAIIFSDILVIPEAMGLPYEMVEKRGPHFPQVIASAADVGRLQSGAAAAEQLGYVYDAVRETRRQLDGRVPLIGFSGAPWTLMAYMVEGGGSKTFSKAKRMLYTDEALAHQLLEKLTDTIIVYLKEKVRSGAQLVQLFDSWGGILSPAQYERFALPYIKEICTAIDEVPVTVFAKGAWFAYEAFGQLDCEVVGIDWSVSPQEARQRVGAGKVLQGNLDPCQLYAPPERVAQATEAMLEAFGRGHIANLGHGVYPDTPLEGVKAFVQAVQNFRYK